MTGHEHHRNIYHVRQLQRGGQASVSIGAVYRTIRRSVLPTWRSGETSST